MIRSRFRRKRPAVPVDLGARPRVVIVGGGFAGLQAAKALTDAPVRITLVDRRNHHLFQPLLYQVATAVLSPADIAHPIRSVLRDQSNVEVILDEVAAIDPTAKEVVLEDGGRLPYDYLILAAGANHAYFGHDEWEPYAPGSKVVEDALEIRRRILLSFEEAEREPDPARRKALMTFVIVGAGPTGVEMAGAIAEIARYSLARDFRHIDTRDAKVILVEASTKLLAAFPERLSRHALQDLQRLGVDVRFGKPVTAIAPEAVTVGDEIIPAHTVIWAAGVQASPLAARWVWSSTGPGGCSSTPIYRSPVTRTRSSSVTWPRSPTPAVVLSPASPRSQCNRACRPRQTFCAPSRGNRHAHFATAISAIWPPSAAIRPSPTSAVCA
jgi:NADH dehydrogenase FAD-containing subunit